MKEEKKEQIKELLEEAKKKMEQLKEENPNESFDQSEAMIEQLTSLLEGKITKKMLCILIVKYVLSFLFLFIMNSFWIAIVLGYSNSLLNFMSTSQFFILLFSIAGIFVILLRGMAFLMNTLKGNPLSFLILFSLVTILSFAFIDGMWIHLCVSMDASLLLGTILWFGFIGLDLWLQRKIFL